MTKSFLVLTSALVAALLSSGCGSESSAPDDGDGSGGTAAGGTSVGGSAAGGSGATAAGGTAGTATGGTNSGGSASGGSASGGSASGGSASGGSATGGTSTGGSGGSSMECGAMGQTCSSPGDCAAPLVCEFNVCIPPKSGDCGGFAGAECEAGSCLYCSSCDYGPCFETWQIECLCATAAGRDAFACPD